MLPSSRHSKSLGREGEGRMVDEGRELVLGRVGAAPSSSMVTVSTCWDSYRCSCRVSFRCRCRWSYKCRCKLYT